MIINQQAKNRKKIVRETRLSLDYLQNVFF